MSTFVLNEKVKFILPAGYEYDSYPGESGRMVNEIHCGEYLDDFGSTEYEFKCGVLTQTFNEVGPGVTPDNLLETALREKFPDYMILPGKPKTAVAAMSTSMADVQGGPLGQLFGMDKMMFILSGFVQTGSYELVMFTIGKTVEDDEEKRELIRHLGTVLDAMRVNGRKIPAAGSISEQFMRKLGLWDGPAREEFRLAFPGQELYPHYNSLRNAGGSFGGITVVVNANGTEYAFIPLKSLAESGDSSSDNAALFRRIVAKDTEAYDLDRKAKEMQPLFHVNASAFDPHHDRECELEQGLMQQASLMSALRSFAWTLADHCEKHSCSPGQVDSVILIRLADFVSQRDSLNYDGSSYCRGLCACSDLHVFYVPDGTSRADKEALLPSQKDRDRVRRMKETFPNYREILDQVHSLNALRKDLAYIYPAVKKLWEHLRENRDRSKALLGSEADIVYAWCALALAAKGPFFTEDGPSTCFFTQLPAVASSSPSRPAVKSAAPAPAKRPAAKPAARTYTPSYIPTSDDYVIRRGELSYVGSKENIRSFVIPEGVTKIALGAFGYCKKLSEVIIPESVIEIGGLAFSNCSSLTKIVIPNSVTKIGDGAFDSCESLTKIVIPEGVTEIGKSAFFGCENLSEIVIPNSVTKIGDRAFCQCNSLTKIVIPNSVTKIGDSAFGHCNSLTKIVIPEGVTEIGNEAFCFCSSLTEVILPERLKKIGEKAFWYCDNLTSVVIPEGVEEIGDSAFECCRGLTDVVVPRSGVKMGEDIFKDCDKLELHVYAGEEAEHVEKLGRKLIGQPDPEGNTPFHYTAEREIVISDGVTDIGDRAFAGCSGLTKVTIPESVTEIGADAFSGCKSLTEIFIPKGVTKIGDGAFAGCSGLTKVTIPKSVTEFGADAFSGCTSLTEILIPKGVTKIGDSAFAFCRGLTKVTLPESVTEIGDSAFRDCKNLTEIDIPEGVTHIGQYAFVFCSAMLKIVIPESVVEIGSSAFSQCRGLKSVTLCSSRVKVAPDAFGIGKKTREIVLLANEERVEERLLAQCQGFSKLILSEGIREIGDFAFFQCPGLDTVYLPSSLEKIGAHAFEQSAKLKDILLPQGVKELGEKAFSDCGSLTDICIPASVQQLANGVFSGTASGRIIHTVSGSAGEAYAKKQRWTVDHASFPKKKPVRRVKIEEPKKAAPKAKKAETPPEKEPEPAAPTATPEAEVPIVAPTKEPAPAAAPAEEVPAVTPAKEIPAAAPAKEPAPAAAAKKNAPESDFWINEQGILQAYYGHEKDLILPDSVQAIGMWAFGNNTGLCSVEIPEGVKRIEKCAFSGCVNLKKVVLPGTIQAIEEMAFWNCGLQSINIPEGCKKIGDSCFGECRELAEIRLPSTIRDIGVNALETENVNTVIHAPDSVRALVPDTGVKKQPKKPAANPQPEKKEGCYIATAVYGAYDAPEVMTLRRFRDEILANTAPGRWFIRTYYRLSPPVAAKLKNAKRVNAFVRHILDRWVMRLERKWNPRS